MKLTISHLYMAAVVFVCVLVALVIYGVIIPDRMASNYLKRLEASGQQLKVSFKTIDKTDNLNVFNNPDTAAQTSQQNLAVINKDIKDCQQQLTAFNKVADSLKRPPLTGSIGTMHKARVQQAHAHTIVAQSKDVLSQYQQLTNFLTAYYNYDKTFQTYTTAVDHVTDLSTLAAQTAQLNAQAQQLQQYSTALTNGATPNGYQQLAAAAAPMYLQASQGFSELASGLSVGSDDQTNNGISLIESAVNTHDSSVAGLPTNLAQNVYIFQQVDELPDKIENLFS